MTGIPIDASYSNPRVPIAGTNDGVGIDVGVKDLAICSTGQIYRNINKTSRVRRLKKNVRRLQCRLSRKYIKSKKGEKYQKTRNIIRSEKQLLRVTHRLTNIRTNHIHQVSTEIVKREPSFIVMEDLNVEGMMKNRHLAQAVQEQKLAEFYRMMRYKSEWHGKRVYRCEQCGTVIDRDLNASMNLLHYGGSILTH